MRLRDIEVALCSLRGSFGPPQAIPGFFYVLILKKTSKYVIVIYMKHSQLFTKTTKTVPKDAESINARLLIQAGYINQEMAGVYSYLPLGLRVLNNIERIVRQEMNAIDGQELLLSSFSSKEAWLQTNRWEGFDVLFKVPAANDKEYALNPTHEEIVTPIAQQHASSYKDFPFAVYQIQTKFRNEARAKSGILRGREFRMKDLYSFHTSQEDLNAYYEQATEAYKRVFNRVGLGDTTYYTFASGGAFTSEYSHEFQTVNDWGEDTIFVCECGTGHNKEIFTDGMKCLQCGKSNFTEQKATEVGNIFKLGTRFSEPFSFSFTDQDGKTHSVIMGCYGIGTSRLMGVVAETLSDEKGLIWPEEVAPFQVHLLSVGKEEEVHQAAEQLYTELKAQGVEVLWDDRAISPGEKFADNELLGIPHRIVISKKTLAEKVVEYKHRANTEIQKMTEQELFSLLSSTKK